jgi:hypothetical protein
VHDLSHGESLQQHVVPVLRGAVHEVLGCRRPGLEFLHQLIEEHRHAVIDLLLGDGRYGPRAYLGAAPADELVAIGQDEILQVQSRHGPHRRTGGLFRVCQTGQGRQPGRTVVPGQPGAASIRLQLRQILDPAQGSSHLFDHLHLLERRLDTAVQLGVTTHRLAHFASALGAPAVLLRIFAALLRLLRPGPAPRRAIGSPVTKGDPNPQKRYRSAICTVRGM